MFSSFLDRIGETAIAASADVHPMVTQNMLRTHKGKYAF